MSELQWHVSDFTKEGVNYIRVNTAYNGLVFGLCAEWPERPGFLRPLFEIGEVTRGQAIILLKQRLRLAVEREKGRTQIP